MFNPQPKPERKEKKGKKPINKKSKKTIELDKEYYTIIKVWKDGKVCKECGNPEIDVHHSAGKVGNINGVPLKIYIPYFVPLCRKCHRKAEDNPSWAKQKGYSRDRNGI